MLDAHQLNIFLVAAETLNFTKAAERLHMSQPSISQHIRALENHFDEPLFIRKGRSLILSDAGRILVPLARQFIKQSTLINEAMSSLKGHIKGRINIGCNAISGGYFLPEYFTKFHQLYPEVTISCNTQLIESPYDLMRKGNIHFLFTNQDRNLEACYDFTRIISDEIVLITHKKHPWAKRDFIEVEELQEEKYILPAERSLIYERISAALAPKDFSLLQLDSFLTLTNSEAIILSVGKGLGVSFGSRIISSTIGTVSMIPIKGVKIKLDVIILRDKTQLSTAARDAFWEFIFNVSDEIKLNGIT
jgi:DNA-binding transcriptional LysR family regulator